MDLNLGKVYNLVVYIYTAMVRCKVNDPGPPLIFIFVLKTLILNLPTQCLLSIQLYPTVILFYLESRQLDLYFYINNRFTADDLNRCFHVVKCVFTLCLYNVRTVDVILPDPGVLQEGAKTIIYIFFEYFVLCKLWFILIFSLQAYIFLILSKSIN